MGLLGLVDAVRGNAFFSALFAGTLAAALLGGEAPFRVWPYRLLPAEADAALLLDVLLIRAVAVAARSVRR
jgi:hypothetical protein